MRYGMEPKLQALMEYEDDQLVTTARELLDGIDEIRPKLKPADIKAGLKAR